MTAPIKHRTTLPAYKGPLPTPERKPGVRYVYKPVGEPMILSRLAVGDLFMIGREVFKFLGDDPKHRFRSCIGELVKGEWETPMRKRFCGSNLVQPCKLKKA